MTRPSILLVRWLISALTALIFLVLMSPATSMFNTVYGGDSAIFRVIGSSLRHGQELYIDVWDHKGPALFFIEWLGQFAYEGRLGIFAIQVIALTVALALTISIARRFLSILATAAVVSLMLAVLTFTLEGGNLSEEFSLPFIVFVLYGAVRVLTEDADPRGAREALLFAAMGAAFAFVFFMRANNALPIVGIFGGMLIQLLLRREPVVKRFGVAVAGFLVVAGLFIGWFALRGTLDDMLNATFWFNLRYVEDASTRPKALAYAITIGLTILLTLAACIGQILRFGFRRSTWALGAMLGATSAYAVVSPATSYAHYLMLILPMLSFGAVMLLHALRARATTLVAALVLISSITAIVYQIPRAMRHYESVRVSEGAYEAQLVDALSTVPEHRRNEIFPWSLPATYYLMTDTLPSYKYFITQPWWGSIDPQVVEDSVEHIAQTRPEWVLVPVTGTSSDIMQQLLDRDYSSVEVTDLFELYRLD